ncbi:hypothetical protein [Pontibacter rugosus]|uniref:Lipocalin-like domain-containing protein n=1 Tax=Pontibacter rugosus TaxID=1745966 RepID=A0ABW3SK93_9BACT
MKLYLPIITLLILCTTVAFTFHKQQSHYSIVGSWKLVDMQIGNDVNAKAASGIDSTLHQSAMRFVFEESGQFRMELSTDGRGFRGGYFYNPTDQTLSIKYGSHTDTALVSWEGADKMIHATKDGQTRTTMIRVTE